MANVLNLDKQLAVLKLLLTGNSLTATYENTGVHRDTCMRLALKFGRACDKFLRREMRDLDLSHIQCDEIWTFVRKKQRKLVGKEKRSSVLGDIFIYKALDEESRVIVAFLVGKRTRTNTNTFMARLAGCLKFPKPHVSDDHHYEQGEYVPITRISTDSLKSYPDAVDAAFGPYARHGILRKEIIDDQVIIYKKGKNIEPQFITTSLIERQNLTDRTFMRRLVRDTLCYSKKLANLEAAVAMHLTYYNYCRTHKTLRTSPAHALGIVGKLWTLPELYDAVMAQKQAVAA